MKITYLIAAAAVGLGLSLPVQPASAGPAIQDGGAAMSQPESDVTLVHGGFSGSFHSGTSHSWSGGPHAWSGRPGGWNGGFHKWSGKPGWNGGVHKWSGKPGWNGHSVPAGAHWGWRHGHRGYWWGGRWYWWGGPYYYGYGGSCYGNCLATGYPPAYCSVYADNYCY